MKDMVTVDKHPDFVSDNDKDIITDQLYKIFVKYFDNDGENTEYCNENENYQV